MLHRGLLDDSFPLVGVGAPSKMDADDLAVDALLRVVVPDRRTDRDVELLAKPLRE